MVTSYQHSSAMVDIRKEHRKLKHEVYAILKVFDFDIYIYIYSILPKVLGRPLLMNRFDYFSNFYEYKS